MKRNPSDALLILAICAVILSAPAFAKATPINYHLSQCENIAISPDFDLSPCLNRQVMAIPKIGRITKGYNLTWGETAGWVNLKAKHSDLKIGSNILAGWVWLENCGWVCLSNGRPPEGGRYTNRGSHDWGVNNDGQGKLSGFAWSEVTGWERLCSRNEPEHQLSKVQCGCLDRLCGQSGKR
ncbi:MAG: hypothetical protein NTZ78_02315 [Candidatus Aureabacteria bacterium]|nr:hypothetical protein [Candidatus Auribacterota bacterium]